MARAMDTGQPCEALVSRGSQSKRATARGEVTSPGPCRVRDCEAMGAALKRAARGHEDGAVRACGGVGGWAESAWRRGRTGWTWAALRGVARRADARCAIWTVAAPDDDVAVSAALATAVRVSMGIMGNDSGVGNDVPSEIK